MAFVSIVLACLGALMIAGFVALYLKLGALADELRDARASDAHALAIHLDAVADKQQGIRLDLTALTRKIEGQQQSVEALTFQLEGPPSLRRPHLPESSIDG